MALNCSITTLGVGFEPSTYVRSSGLMTTLTAAEATIEPLDTAGSPDADGKILGVGLGMSTSDHVFARLETIIAGVPTNPAFVWKSVAQNTMVASDWEDPLNECWDVALTKLGVGNTAAQVQFVCVMITESGPPPNMTLAQLRSIYDNIFTFFPNTKMVFWMSHPYTGYDTGSRLPGPDCHDNQALLADNIADADLNDVAPSDYYSVYCDGETPNVYTQKVGAAIETDYEFSMACLDYDETGHLLSSGLEKVAQSLLARWLEDPATAFMFDGAPAGDVMSNSRYLLGPMPPVAEWIDVSVSGPMRIDGDTERFAAKLWPQTTSPITHVDFRIDTNGAVSGINWVMEIQSDNGDVPSGTVLGAATAEFTVSADGWTGSKALASNTGALTVGQPIWLVFRRSSGDSTSATVWIQPYRLPVTSLVEKLRHFNGTNWTTTTFTPSPGTCVLTHADSSYTGFPMTSGDANPSLATDVYDTNKQGLRFQVGARMLLSAVNVRFLKVGTPDPLVVTVAQPAISKTQSFTFAQNLVDNLKNNFLPFTPVIVYPGVDAYVILSQQDVTGAGDSSNYYRVRMGLLETAAQPYLGAVASLRWRLVYGTSSDFTLLTVSGGDVPMMSLVVQSFESHLQASGPRFLSAAGGRMGW